MDQIKLNTIKNNEDYAVKEAFRTLKTNILFCGDNVKRILFTSTAPDEGKTTVAMKLAQSMAESKKKVLVIDTDMRKSILMGRLGARKEGGGKLFGLSHLLTGQKSLEDVVYSTDVAGLYLVFAGPSVPNPTEILENQYFTSLMNFANQYFDYVIIDCPPIGAAIDAAVIAQHCDGAVLVVAQGQVSSRAILNAKKQLESSGVRILGAVLNKVERSKGGRYGYYGKYYGKYYGNYYGNESSGKQSKK